MHHLFYFWFIGVEAARRASVFYQRKHDVLVSAASALLGDALRRRLPETGNAGR